MHSRLPEGYKIDFGRYLSDYLRQPDAISKLPTEDELLALAHKDIIKEQLVLAPLPAGEAAQKGDTAVLRVMSGLPRFNKEKVTVSLGRGLYSTELELALIGKRAEESVTVQIQDKPVTAEILELKRRQAPEPTDEMVRELHAKTNTGREILTVKEYEDYIRQEKTMSVLGAINYYVVSRIIEELPEIKCSEEDIRVLGELERDYFVKLFLETEHIDIRESLPDSWKQNGVNTLDDFIAVRREWYTIKIKQCLIFLDILGLPCEGKTDPLDHYEVLQEMQLKIFDLIKKELERR